MTTRIPQTRTHASGAVRRRLWAFVGVAVLVLVAIGFGTVLVARHVARQTALQDAERTTQRLAHLVVAPLLPGVLAGDPMQRDQLNRAMEVRLADGSVTEIDIWDGNGTVVYCDTPSIIGQTFPTTPQLLATVNQGVTSADIALSDETSDLPPNVWFVEVYVPLRLPGRQPMAFEAYYSAQELDEETTALATDSILLALVPLIILQTVQVPIAIWLTRRVSRQEVERAALLNRALSASDRERRSIATNLHDGVVQDLAGVGYALAAITTVVPNGQRDIAESCAASVRDAVGALRLLMVDIYPPDLSGPGLADAINGLAQPLRDMDTQVSVDVASLPTMTPDAAVALYRVAREAITNIVKHARATEVVISLGVHDGDTVWLRVIDNGVGIPVDAFDRRPEGHFGLHMLADNIADLGGRFTVTAAPNGGTIAEATVPIETGS
ncbi:MAG TPA: ATP-binding protein [Pseudonocardiaceae bacterium]|jgi:signal transduction histidine kinase